MYDMIRPVKFHPLFLICQCVIRQVQRAPATLPSGAPLHAPRRAGLAAHLRPPRW